MIKINKSTKYALYSMFELCKDPQAILSATQIAAIYGISEHHVAKVLQQLKRSGFINSIRGIKGGFQLAKPAKSITMVEIIAVFEMPQNGGTCILVDDQQNCCKEKPCPIGELFNEIDEYVYFTLKSVSFATLLSEKKII